MRVGPSHPGAGGPTGRPESPRSNPLRFSQHNAPSVSQENVQQMLDVISTANSQSGEIDQLVGAIKWVEKALISGSSEKGGLFVGGYKGITSRDISLGCLFHKSTHRQEISKNIASVLEVFKAVLKTSADDKVVKAINDAKERIADAIIGGGGSLLLKKLKNEFSPNDYKFEATHNPLIITDYKYGNANGFVTGQIEKGVAQNNDRDTEIQYWENFCLALKNEAKSEKGKSGLRVVKEEFKKNVKNLNNSAFNEELEKNDDFKEFIDFHNNTLNSLESLPDVNPLHPSPLIPPPHISPLTALADAVATEVEEAARLLEEFGSESEVDEIAVEQEASIKTSNTYNQRGFKNIGNSCYMNTALQVLLGSFNLDDSLIKNPDMERSEEQKNNTQAVIDSFKKLRDAWNNGNPSEEQLKKFNSALCTRYPDNFSKGKQCDATEVVSSLIQSLGLDDGFVVPCTQTITDIKDKELSKTSSKDFPLALALGDDSKTTMQDLIDLYQKKENLTGDDQYKYNRKKIDAIKKVEITPGATSDILTFSLKRFENTQNKNKKSIVINEDIKIMGETYRVKSIGIHSGAHNVGHYFAYNRDGEDWFCMDDFTVSKVSQEDVLEMASGITDSNCQAYFLTYEKVKIGEPSCIQIDGESTDSSIETRQQVTISDIFPEKTKEQLSEIIKTNLFFEIQSEKLAIIEEGPTKIQNQQEFAKEFYNKYFKKFMDAEDSTKQNAIISEMLGYMGEGEYRISGMSSSDHSSYTRRLDSRGTFNIDQETLDAHVSKMRNNGIWGGQEEIMALSYALKIPICVYNNRGILSKKNNAFNPGKTPLNIHYSGGVHYRPGQNGIKDVPGDGNCLFHAILHQLSVLYPEEEEFQRLGVQELRDMACNAIERRFWDAPDCDKESANLMKVLFCR